MAMRTIALGRRSDGALGPWSTVASVELFIGRWL
jgi:hypothetical protein